MPVASVGPVKLPDVNSETWLVKFDKDGLCTSPQTRQALIARLKEIGNTPVILISHGWNNDFDDASELYRKFLLQLQHLTAVQPLGRPAPLVVGVLWPSIWLSFDSGLQMAAEGAFGPTVSEQQIINDIKSSLPDDGTRQRFEILMSEKALDADQVRELSTLLQRAWTASYEPEIGTDASAPTQDEICAALNALPVSVGLAENDDDDLPPTGVIGAGNLGTSASVQPAGLLNYFDPRWALRLASVYQMKDRAGIVGMKGVSLLLADILDSIDGPLHLVGHSYGCKVILSALTHAGSPKNVASALLLQPAISHLCFASKLPNSGKAAGYAETVKRVEKSLLMTYSAKDFALHNVFHLALRRDGDIGESGIAGDGAPPPVPSLYSALGGYGPRQSNQKLLGRLPEPLQAYNLPTDGSPAAFDGSDGQINGHGDVATSYTAWLMYLQLKT